VRTNFAPLTGSTWICDGPSTTTCLINSGDAEGSTNAAVKTPLGGGVGVGVGVGVDVGVGVGVGGQGVGEQGEGEHVGAHVGVGLGVGVGVGVMVGVAAAAITTPRGLDVPSCVKL
jgi:hypothetical protein